MSDDGDGASWVETKRRPKPPPLSGSTQEVSRCSGLSANTGTFGKSSRFADKKVVGPGTSSPYGHLFYHRNQLYKSKLEAEKSCSLGIGDRPRAELMGNPPNVGPGSYNIVASAAGAKSPLDGADFCTTTMKVKLPSSLTGLPMASPGPHARYEVRTEDFTAHLPKFAKHKPLLGHNARFHDIEDRNDVGPGSYSVDTYKTVATSASCPNLSGAGEGCMDVTGGTKRCLKSTFGVANRFAKEKVPNSSPQGDRYYAHSKIWDDQEYLNNARSCGFGACGKTDMSNPLKGPRHNTSPATYYPEGGYSACGKTSALDGLTSRCRSPVAQFAQNLGSTKSANRPRRSPAGPSGGGADS